MAKVGRKIDPRFNPKLLQTIRLVGLGVAFLIIFYSSFIYFSGTNSPSPLYSDGAMIFSTLVFVALPIGNVVLKPSTKRSLTLYMALSYLAASFYAMFVVGDAPAVYIFAIVLTVATGVVLGLRTMLIGIAYASVLMVTLGILHPNHDGEQIVSIIISTIMMAGTAVTLFWMRSSNLVRIELYEDLKTREELQSKRLETIMNSLNDAVLSVDVKTGIIHLYNAATLSLLDTNKDVDGLKVDSLFKLTDEDGTTVSLAKLIRNSTKFVERNDLIHSYSNGQKINLYLSISPIHDAFSDDAATRNMENVIIIARDITKQKSLDDERDEFIAVVSHELRTPVTITEGALSNIQFLLDRGGDTKLLEKTLSDAHQQVLFLAQMVNDLSTLSRAQRDVDMDPENIDVNSFLNDLRNKYINGAKKQHLKLELDVHVNGEVCTPRTAIEEVMQNLITNAIKYTEEGSVTIGAHLVGINGSEAEFFVRDTGIGISKSDQTHVYGRFWRSEDYRTRETSGTGLGLHVVNQLALKMNTRIELKSRLNHGSTFSFRLPLLVQSTAKDQVSDKSDD